MGNRFVVIIENKAARTQGSINKEFPPGKTFSAETPLDWELFVYDDKSYAMWILGISQDEGFADS